MDPAIKKPAQEQKADAVAQSQDPSKNRAVQMWDPKKLTEPSVERYLNRMKAYRETKAVYSEERALEVLSSADYDISNAADIMRCELEGPVTQVRFLLNGVPKCQSKFRRKQSFPSPPIPMEINSTDTVPLPAAGARPSAIFNSNSQTRCQEFTNIDYCQGSVPLASPPPLPPFTYPPPTLTSPPPPSQLVSSPGHTTHSPSSDVCKGEEAPTFAQVAVEYLHSGSDVGLRSDRDLHFSYKFNSNLSASDLNPVSLRHVQHPPPHTPPPPPPPRPVTDFGIPKLETFVGTSLKSVYEANVDNDFSCTAPPITLENFELPIGMHQPTRLEPCLESQQQFVPTNYIPGRCRFHHQLRSSTRINPGQTVTRSILLSNVHPMHSN